MLHLLLPETLPRHRPGETHRRPLLGRLRWHFGDADVAGALRGHAPGGRPEAMALSPFCGSRVLAPLPWSVPDLATSVTPAPLGCFCPEPS